MTPLFSKESLVRLPLVVAVALTIISPAQAELLGRGGGTMVYDTDLNITWVADAMLFKTLANASEDPNSYVQDIIDANNGVIYDTPNSEDGRDGVYNLSSFDLNTSNGRTTWFGALAWTNSLVYGGYSDWRLPTTSPAAEGFNAGSEMGHLFYTELNGSAHSHIPDSSLFVNTTNSFWTNRENQTSAPFNAWLFSLSNGSQSLAGKTAAYFAWAVRDGDVAAVPVPGAVWLFGSAILGFAALKRRSSKA
ncbi:DUF1566 domain-containing protein [Methylomonas montana]|uniref:Lcl domain-containing protein n=1 Tax=Methylomonas montana TaxID=3058963 RepID=UPI002657E259|nr:DUF1566 domain-containing protein [Methylomonas montana]WKJ88923.1 DUF1566 domain-containing protein [Methylomonas montana]